MTVGIIGTGWGARVQVPAFRSAGLEVTALAGHDSARTEHTARELGVPFATADWREVLKRDDVALVSIVVPPNLHSLMAVEALAAGKHVLCEKPTALDAAQAREMLAAAQAHPNQLALIDHELRFLPGLRQVRRMIAEGAIGEVRMTVAQSIASGRADPQRAWNWWSDAAQGGGLWGAIGSHQVDTLRYLLRCEVERVVARLETFVPERPGPDGPRRVTADDTFGAQLTLSGGTLATFQASAVARLSEPDSLTLYGAEGTLRWVGGRLWHAAPGLTLQDITPVHDYPPPVQSGDFAYGTLYLGHALRAYLAGDQEALAPAATFADGLRVQETLDAARRSHQENGAWATVNGR